MICDGDDRPVRFRDPKWQHPADMLIEFRRAGSQFAKLCSRCAQLRIDETFGEPKRSWWLLVGNCSTCGMAVYMPRHWFEVHNRSHRPQWKADSCCRSCEMGFDALKAEEEARAARLRDRQRQDEITESLWPETEAYR